MRGIQWDGGRGLEDDKGRGRSDERQALQSHVTLDKREDKGSVATAGGGGWPQLLSTREERREMGSFPSTGLSTKLA